MIKNIKFQHPTLRLAGAVDMSTVWLNKNKVKVIWMFSDVDTVYIIYEV